MTRVLFVDMNVITLNPSSTSLPILIASAFPETTFYGPGFRSDTELKRGLKHWVSETGPYKIIVFGAQCPFSFENKEDALIGLKWHVKHNTAKNFDLSQLADFVNDLFETVPNLDVENKILSTMGFDYYAARQFYINRIIDWGFNVLGPNSDLIGKNSELPNFKKFEKHYIKKKDMVSDRWLNFLQEYPNRVFTSPHFVLPSEFHYAPLSLRSPKVAIPGVSYYLRKENKKALKKANISIGNDLNALIVRGLQKVGLPLFSTYFGLRFYNKIFQEFLKRSRYVYTSSGVFGYAVRKFFEIPASGALMLCSPCNGFENLGFVSGQHYLNADTLNIASLVRELESAQEGQVIAAAGQRLVLEKHSLFARAKQISDCFEAQQSNKYFGSYWKNGNFVIRNS